VVVIVCHCFVVNDRRIREAVAAGATTVEDVADMSDAGSLCGGCHSAICGMLADHAPGACRGDECAVSMLRARTQRRNCQLVEAM
jgi:bacterioferritin-associated ferredoxin